MRLTNCLILLSFLPCTLQAQSPFGLKQEDSVMLDADYFTVDAIGYIYSSYKDIIEKRDTTHRLWFRQSTKMTGTITSIDVTNPLKPMLFFLPQQSIQFIDNTLTPYQDLGALSDMDVSYATLVCYSEQFNRFWIYDQDNSRLTLFDPNGSKIRVVENLAGLVGIQNPCQLLEKNGTVYIVDENRGVYLFDMFGTMVNFYEIPNLHWIQADEHNIYYVSDQKLHSKNIQFGTEYIAEEDVPFETAFRISRDLLYFKKGREIDIFKIILKKSTSK